MGLLTTTPVEISDRVAVTAQLNHRLMPIDRGERYEDPLNGELQKNNFGGTDGGGTLLAASTEIDYVDVETFLTQTDKSIPFVIERLESYGAPEGSKLIMREGGKKREIPFGRAEGFGVYLDGVTLPKEVYQSCDVNLVIDELNKLLAGRGSIQSYWEGKTETALYIYGDDAESMKKLIEPFLGIYPLCRGSRVVTIAPRST
jgi:hypothetical protein